MAHPHRKYQVSFRLRSYFCKACHVHVEFSGNDPVVGSCPCGTALTSLPKEDDSWIETVKKVYPYAHRPGAPLPVKK